MAWRAISFAVLTAALALLSRPSLPFPRSHGFSRFLAWEAMAALFLLVLPHWFAAPLDPHQLASWALLGLSLVPLAWGTALLRGRGAPAGARDSDPSLLAFERTTRLVDTGIYRWIRHPMYASLLLLAWGIFFKRPSWAGAALAALASALLVRTALLEEAECVRFFGPEYEAYMRRTRRFLPLIF